MLRYILIILLLSTLSISAPIDKKRVLVSKIGENRYKMRIYFNYENPYEIQKTLIGRNTQYSPNIPIPDKFEVLDVYVSIKYTSSFVLEHTRSIIAIKANNYIVRQFGLNERQFKDSGMTTVTAQIPTDLLSDYNRIGVKIIQHYTDGTVPEDTSSPELWTQIDVQNSYIEIIFKLKEFEEKLSSIKKFILDEKNIFKDILNFVFPKYPTDEDFFNYGFFAHFAGRTLKFRDIDFSVSTKIDDRRNNIIIMLRKDLKKVFEKYRNQIPNLDKKLAGNINVIRNPHRTDKGFIVITGDTYEEIRNGLFRLNKDLFLLDEQNIKVLSVKIPPPSKPYSTPGYVLPGNKVFFSELGYKTRTFYGEQADNLYLNFRLYPTVHYDDSDTIQSVIKTIHSEILRGDSATNVYMNGNLAYQYRTAKNTDNDPYVGRRTTQRFELKHKNYIPSTLLKPGKNTLMIEFAMVPINGPELVRFNDDILKIVVREDSYLLFPKAKTEIEYPNLKYISDLAFPYSIYPDLRNTGILITDFDSRTVASAMYIAFFLGKLIDYPAYRLVITPDINQILLKDIITIGKQVERFSLLYQNAPLKFTKDGLIKELSLGTKYINENGKRVERIIATTKIVESINFQDYLIVQTYQSPFNPRRVILDISANDPATLYKGVRNGFTPIHLNNFKGDAWFYNVKTNKSQSFRLKDTYILDEVVEGFNKKIFE